MNPSKWAGLWQMKNWTTRIASISITIDKFRSCLCSWSSHSHDDFHIQGPSCCQYRDNLLVWQIWDHTVGNLHKILISKAQQNYKPFAEPHRQSLISVCLFSFYKNQIVFITLAASLFCILLSNLYLYSATWTSSSSSTSKFSISFSCS